MADTFITLSERDRTSTDDFLSLVDDFNTIISNINIIYGMNNATVTEILEALDQESSIQTMIDTSVEDSIDNQIDISVDAKLSTKVADEVEDQLEAIESSLTTIINNSLTSYQESIDTQFSDFQASVNSQIAVITQQVADLESGIEALVQSYISANLSGSISTLVADAFASEMDAEIKSIQIGEPDESGKVEGSFWLEEEASE